MIDYDKHYPALRLSQALYPLNGDGYFYFNQLVIDGEESMRVPCLLSNKKEVIRFDIYKKRFKDDLLLVNEKYELPGEIESPLNDSSENSLQAAWAIEWTNGKIAEEQISPTAIINEIESLISKTVSLDLQTRKVLSLWIYSTYYYDLFRSGYPYLLINGAKGTGKTTIALMTSLLAFNPKHTINITEAALYRQISMVGGTLIMDADDYDFGTPSKESVATILKGGYSDTGSVMRLNADTKQTVSFSTFGPKVITNVSGVDEVIADRCIAVSGSVPQEAELSKLKNPFDYKHEKRDVVRSLSSRAVLSALENFEKVHALHKEPADFNTGNARWNQIIRPLYSIAKLVGQDYLEHLLAFARLPETVE